MKCLDSTLLIDLLNGQPAAVKKAKELMGDAVVTTSVNVAEICVGIFKRKGEREFEAFRHLMEAVDILPFDADAAILAGMISGELFKQGKSVSGMDAFVAGAMLAKRCTTIVTRDKEHFQRIKGIKVETY